MEHGNDRGPVSDGLVCVQNMDLAAGVAVLGHKEPREVPVDVYVRADIELDAAGPYRHGVSLALVWALGQSALHMLCLVVRGKSVAEVRTLQRVQSLDAGHSGVDQILDRATQGSKRSIVLDTLHELGVVFRQFFSLRSGNRWSDVRALVVQRRQIPREIVNREFPVSESACVYGHCTTRPEYVKDFQRHLQPQRVLV